MKHDSDRARYAPEGLRDALDESRANAIAAFRCCVLSGLYEDFWAYRAAASDARPAVLSAQRPGSPYCITLDSCTLVEMSFDADGQGLKPLQER